MIAIQSICTAQNIFELNENKEYTLMATHLLEKVLTDPNLNAHASALWQILFNKARFNENLEVKISYNQLANMLGKSTRTIYRYVKTLEKNNYIIIQNNYYSNGGQTANTILVRFPKTGITEATETKDRLKPKVEEIKPHITEEFVEHTDEPIPNCNETVNPMEYSEYQEMRSQNTTTSSPTRTEDSSNIHDKIIDQEIIGQKDQTSSSHENSAQEEINTSDVHSNLSDKNVIGEGDKNVVRNNNINNINTKNNNNVVVSSNIINNNPNESSKQKTKEDPEIIDLEKKMISKQNILKQITQHRSIVKQEFNEVLKSKNNVEIYTVNRKLSQLDANYEIHNHQLDHLQNILKQKRKEFKKQEVIESDPKYMVNRQGTRAIHPFTFNRLAKNLEALGYQSSDKIRLINEMVFEARFGSLIKSNITNSEMSVERSVNIALKLIREGRWSTPTLLKNYISKTKEEQKNMSM